MSLELKCRPNPLGREPARCKQRQLSTSLAECVVSGKACDIKTNGVCVSSDRGFGLSFLSLDRVRRLLRRFGRASDSSFGSPRRRMSSVDFASPLEREKASVCLGGVRVENGRPFGWKGLAHRGSGRLIAGRWCWRPRRLQVRGYAFRGSRFGPTRDFTTSGRHLEMGHHWPNVRIRGWRFRCTGNPTELQGVE